MVNTASTTEVPTEIPEVPEGMDEAIFMQGWLAGRKVAAGALPIDNQFTADTPQAASWQAGYDAGKTVAAPEAADWRKSKRHPEASD
jgi:hypothetical protein